MTTPNLDALSSFVRGRGRPPTPFLLELIAWAKTAPDEIFAVNDEPGDVMGHLAGILGPWEGELGSPVRLLHRKAALCELLRCLAGFEASWHWQEGVDMSNFTSQHNIVGEETGIFQVSYDSLALEHQHQTLRDLLASKGIETVQQFLPAMKQDHAFAFEYAARLLRINYRWDGPILRGEIDSSLSREAVAVFREVLAEAAD